METFLTVIHVLAALLMILVVLIQGGNQGGIGAAFGGGNSQGVFGASGATSFLGKVTYVVAAVFMITSVSLTVFQGSSGETGLSDRLEQATQEQGTEKSPEESSSQPEPEQKP